MYYTECAQCGANLDPGEICDCQKEKGPSNTNQIGPKTDDESVLNHSLAQISKEIKNYLKSQSQKKEVLS